MKHDENQLITDLESETRAIESLSSYRFVIGIENDENMGIVLSDTLTMRLSDYLYYLENGSALNGIVATMPIDRTVRESRETINECLQRCSEGILSQAFKKSDIDAEMKNAAMKITAKLRMNVPSAIAKYCVCYVTFKNAKI